MFVLRPVEFLEVFVTGAVPLRKRSFDHILDLLWPATYETF